ncbi:MAG TPA: hydroxyacid dehydrogenase [Opitutales bacterium]|nr:hydroxyacid dehydrogenase [Opitutales bacterium]
MMNPKLLIALTEDEKKDFLPPKVLARLDELPLDIEWLDLPLESVEDWPGILAEKKPDALMAAWACPRLPDDLTVGEGGLRYVAYLAGSIRKLVPRELLVNGLQVTNWGNSISRTISECGLLLTLSAMRRASRWSVAMHRDGAWKQGLQTVTQSLFERRVGIHGFGNIAQQMVPLLKPFDVSISAFSPSVPDAVFEDLGVARSNSLEELFSQNDVIIELAPYHERNHHIVTEKLLRSIPPGGAFVNIGRGAVVDEAAMIRVAKDRADDLQLALDVYEKEPLARDSPLRGLPNVALLPHIAGPTKDRRCDSSLIAIENLARLARGEPIGDAITPEQFDRAT